MSLPPVPIRSGPASRAPGVRRVALARPVSRPRPDTSWHALTLREPQTIPDGHAQRDQTAPKTKLCPGHDRRNRGTTKSALVKLAAPETTVSPPVLRPSEGLLLTCTARVELPTRWNRLRAVGSSPRAPLHVWAGLTAAGATSKATRIHRTERAWADVEDLRPSPQHQPTTSNHES